MRSHTVLNNLHQVIDNVPVVLFYPGNYDGQELVLFGEIKDDNYYEHSCLWIKRRGNYDYQEYVFKAY